MKRKRENGTFFGGGGKVIKPRKRERHMRREEKIVAALNLSRLTMTNTFLTVW